MWEKINKFVHSHTVLSTLLLVVLFNGLLTIFSVTAIPDSMEVSLQLAIFTIGQLVLSAIAIWLMRKLQVFNINDFKFKGVGKGFLLGWVAIVYVIISFLVSFLELPANSLVAPNMLYLLIVFVHLLLGTGVLEEVLFRGLILKTLLKKMGQSKKGIINACFISAAFFGIGHIVNIFNIADKSSIGSYLPITSQLVCATAFGVFCVALFLRTKTLWVPILLHTLANLPAYIIDAITSPGDILQITETMVEIDIPRLIFVDTLLVSLPFLIAGLVLLRKVKPDDIADLIPEYSVNV